MNNMVPHIRFSKFSDKWACEKLETVFANRRQRGSKNLPIYSVSIEKGLVPRDSLERNIANDANDEDNLLVNPGDLAYNMMRMWQGAIGFSDRECMISPAYVVLQPTRLADSKFFYYLFNTQRSLYLFTSYSYGVTSDRLRLYFKDFASIKVSFPSISEQKRIASFLTTIDQKIAQLKQKKLLLERYKKGVMQQLFSQKIRFKDINGNGYPEWEKRKFSKVYSFKATSSFSRDQMNYDDGEVMNIHYGDVHSKFAGLFSVRREVVPFINKDVQVRNIDKNDEHNILCKEGDLVIADASEDVKDVGKAIELVDLDNKKVIAGLHTILARPDLSKVAVRFGCYLMQSESIRKQLAKVAQGTKVYSISQTFLSKLDIELPCKEEQNKIVRFLSSIDEKISFTQVQIDKSTQWKRGLLQKMFI